MIDHNAHRPESKYEYLPKVGESKTFKLGIVKEVREGNTKFHFISKTKKTVFDASGKAMQVDVEENLGWHVEATLADSDKILSVTSFPAYLKTFYQFKLNDGDVVVIEHPEKGVWKVEVLGKV